MTDAASSNGRLFRLAGRRTQFGLFDAPPALIGASLRRGHIAARQSWVKGLEGEQIGWSHHGRVHILRLPDGVEVAAWHDEVVPA